MSFLKFIAFLKSQPSPLDLSEMCTDEEVLSLELSGNSMLQMRGDWGDP